jgi:hypothetical protein
MKSTRLQHVSKAGLTWVRAIQGIGLLLGLLLLLPNKSFGQPPCDSAFTGLTSPMCSAAPAVTLMPNTPGGTFTGPGIAGNVFDPSVAGVGTHTISYSVSVPAGANYIYSNIPFVAPPAVSNLVTLGDDDITASLPIGFTFNYYGTNYTQFEISSNGYMTFDLGTLLNGCCQGQILPDPTPPNNVITGLWDDLYPPGAGTVGYQTFGTAPNRYLVVSWTGTPFCCGATPDVTSSIVLYETSNIIEIHTTNVSNATLATMGIENVNGTLATIVPGFNQANINVTNLGSRFTPSSPCSLNSSSQTVVVENSPTVTASANPNSICPGGSTTLTASGSGLTYTWNPGNLSGASVTVNPSVTTTYTVTSTGANSCTNTATITITVTAQLPITITSTPAIVCVGGTAQLTANGASTYTWMPGNLTGTTVSVTPATSTVYTVTGSNAANCTGSATYNLQVSNMTVTISPNVNPCTDTLFAIATGGAINGPNPGAKFYIRDTDPWSTANNTTAMTAVFGAANYTTLTFAAANPATVFAPTTQFVFLEGSDGNALALNTYITANITAIENWVNAGGRLFLNAAPNGGGNMNWGFGGVVLDYSNAQSNVAATAPLHPIYSGPFTPVITAYTGSSYSHAHITGGGTTSLLAGGGFNVLTEKAWGSGLVMFGGITSPNFHTPAIEAQNLWQNIISYTSGASVAPSYTYLWSNSAVTQSITPTSVGVYTVTVSNGGCLGTATYNLTSVVPNVTTSTNNATICPGVSTTLTASGASSYQWNPGSLSGASVSVSPGVTTTYTVTGMDALGCTKTSTITITVTGQLPLTTSANPATICLGASSTLNVSGANTYTWMPGSLSGSTVTVTPTANTSYTVTGTNALGCTGSAVVNVNVIDLSSLTITQTGTNCVDTLTASVTGGGPISGAKFYIRDSDPWSTANNTTAMTAVFGAANYTTLSFAAANPATIFAPTTQFVFLEGSDGNAIALNTYITANITAIENWVNAGGRLFLNAAPNGGGNMNWGFGGVVLNYNNAQSAVNALVPAHPIFNGPFVPVTTAYTGGSYSHAHITGGTTTPLLAGSGFNVLSELTWGAGLVMFGGITSPNFHAPLTEAQNLWQNIISYVSGGSGPSYSYLWSTNAVTQSIGSLTAGTYTVTVTSGGCSATATYNYAPVPPPIVVATANPPVVCNGQSTLITATGANTYTWMPGSLAGGSITVTPSTTTTYTVTGTGVGGCTNTATITIQNTGIIPVTATGTPSTICPGGSATMIATGANTYVWNPGAINGATAVVSPGTNTIYTVTGTNTVGCTGTATVAVNTSPNPNVTASVAPSPNICQGDLITLTGNGAATYVWTGGVTDGQPFAPPASATYTVTGSNAAGCSGTASISINVTPNLSPGITSLSSTPVLVYTGQSTTFTVNVPVGITNYTIRWYRNGVLANTTANPVFTYTYTPNSVSDSLFAWLIPTGCYNPDSIKTNTLEPRIPIGLNEIEIPAGFELYPNPTANVININGVKAGDEMIITDVVGKTITRKNIDKADKLTINMSAWSAGVYYAKFNREGKNWIIKVVKE